MTMETLHDLLVTELKDLYSAENQLIKVLPKAADAAYNAQLRETLTSQFRQSEEHARRLEEIFSAGLDGSPRGKKCAAIAGLVVEGNQIIGDNGAADVMDAALISVAQRIEHYQIAGYGTARAHAQQLGYMNAARLIQLTLGEESAADERLTEIAEGSVNAAAAQKHDSPATPEPVGSR